MPSLKSLRNRITSIKSTRKITQAMKVVSASKLKKARDAMDGNRPYAKEVNQLAYDLVTQISNKNAFPILYGRENTGSTTSYLIMVFGSERGLCGSFNSALAKTVKHDVKTLEAQGADVSILCIGSKIYNLLKYSMNTKMELLYNDAKHFVQNAQEMAEDLIRRFKHEEFDFCSAYYNSFISVSNRDIMSRQLIPIYRNDAENGSEEEKNIFECEPRPEVMVEGLIRSFIIGNMVSVSYESIASEHGARMTSMDNATRNAGEMIQKLTTIYNRSRQASVTTELIEIISGAESIKQ